jgi:hypothetical protein
MYKTATFLVQHYWGRPAEVADSLGVLLLTWNQAHYRYGSFDFQLLEDALTANQVVIRSFRIRKICSYVAADDPSIKLLFNRLLEALRITTGKRKVSPVAVVKALHLLAPEYFPLWDFKIARAYGCAYAKQPAARYLDFLRKMKDLVKQLDVQGAIPDGSGKTSLKVLDEYNYATYTKRWA